MSIPRYLLSFSVTGNIRSVLMKIALQRIACLSAREKSHNVMVDVDAGVDDAVALLMLLAADSIGEIKIHGITCTHGNTSVQNVCTNVLRTLGAVGRLDVPVFRGAECALIPRESSIGDHLEHFHGLDGFGDLTFPHVPNKKLIQSENAISALNRLARHLSGTGSKLTLVCLAPLTNIALTLRTYPDFSKTLKEVYIMGGNSTGMGNITATGEFNFYSDPEAAHIVLSSLECPVYLLPWETCLAVDIPMDWRFGVLGKVPTPHMELLNAVEKKVWERSSYNKWFPCDAILAALMLKPDIIINSRLCHVLVELHGRHTRGQVVIDHLQTHEPNVFLVEKINVELLKKMLLWMAGCKESEFNPFRISKLS